MQLGCKLLITLENRVYGLLWHLLRQQTDDPHHWEATHHSDGTTVDRIDGVASQHIDDGETHTPDETSPDGSCGHTTPVEAQHERCEESTCQCAPGDTHELGDERRRIEGDEQ